MSDLTSWDLIHAAAQGEAVAREEFSRRYVPVVRASLKALSSPRPGQGDLDDAVSEVLLECFKLGGVLERARPGRGTGFRALLYAVCRNVVLRQRSGAARRLERGADTVVLGGLRAEDEETLGRAFDRAWANEVLREAGEHQLRAAQGQGPEAVRRVELLRLRFHEGLEVRQISARLGLAPDFVHHEYAQARKEFKRSLHAVIAGHNPGEPEQAAGELRELLELYSTGRA